MNMPSLHYLLSAIISLSFSSFLLFVELHPVYFKQCIIINTIFKDNHENSTPLTPWRRHYKDRQGLQHNSTSLHIQRHMPPKKDYFFLTYKDVKKLYFTRFKGTEIILA